MIAQGVVETIREEYQLLGPELDERARRRWEATEAMGLGHGGITAVTKATGLAQSTIRIGRRELREQSEGRAQERPRARRVRRRGAGRKRLTNEDPQLVTVLETLVEPTTRGDPMSPLRWTCKSTRRLAEELTR